MIKVTEHIKSDFIGHVPFNVMKFSGGEIQVAADIIYINTNIVRSWDDSISLFTITANIKSSDDIMELLMVTDALRRMRKNSSISLVMPYIPYARQDRVMNKGEALSIKVFAQLINSQNYQSVTVWDVHSDVSTALIDRCTNIPFEDLFALNGFQDFFAMNNFKYLVSPDAGAMKKAFKVASKFGMEVIRADKIRDTKTGQISGTKVYSEHLGDSNVVIFDDICDGGRTFIELAQKLKEITTGKIYLAVTHGIFSKGLQPLKDVGIYQVGCPNSWIEPDNVFLFNRFGAWSV